MKVAIPKEIREHETRVAASRAMVKKLVGMGVPSNPGGPSAVFPLKVQSVSVGLANADGGNPTMVIPLPVSAVFPVNVQVRKDGLASNIDARTNTPPAKSVAILLLNTQ